jgi:DNA topoisomerase 6 subunit A-like protein
VKEPDIVPAEFSDASIDIIGPSGNLSGVLFCEKEGFNPLFKAVNLANRFDLMIISTKGVSVTAARKLIDEICGGYGIPLFVLHDFDVAGFLILATLQRDTRRYQFSNAFEVIDLGLRLADIAGLEREPAAASKVGPDILRAQLAENGGTEDEIAILFEERVELNAMTSDALIEMIERKLNDYGLEKVIPDDELLAETYRAFHRSQQLRTKFEEIAHQFDETAPEVEIPPDLQNQVRAVLNDHDDLRWDDAIQIVLDKTQLVFCG